MVMDNKIYFWQMMMPLRETRETYNLKERTFLIRNYMRIYIFQHINITRLTAQCTIVLSTCLDHVKNVNNIFKFKKNMFTFWETMKVCEIFGASQASHFMNNSHWNVTYLSIDVNRICGGTINFKFCFSIFCNLSDKWYWIANIVIFIRHFYIKKANWFFWCGTCWFCWLKILSVWLKIFFVTWRVKVL